MLCLIQNRYQISIDRSSQMSTSQSLCLSFGAARAAQLSESPSRTQLQAFSTRDRRGPGCVLIATTVTATVRKRIRAQPRPSASLLKSIATGKTISICTQSFHLPRASIESPLPGPSDPIRAGASYTSLTPLMLSPSPRHPRPGPALRLKFHSPSSIPGPGPASYFENSTCTV